MRLGTVSVSDGIRPALHYVDWGTIGVLGHVEIFESMTATSQDCDLIERASGSEEVQTF